MTAMFDRMQDEGEGAWVAFQRYRDLPNPRPTLAVFSDQTGYAEARVKHWAKQFMWDSRIVAWDQRVDGVRQAATLRGVEEMAQRHVELAKKGLDIVGVALGKIQQDLTTDFSRLKPQEIARLLDVCSKLERLSRGEATDRIDGPGPDYGKLSDEELAALEAISRKV